MSLDKHSLRYFFQLRKVPFGIYPLVGMMAFALTGGSYFVIHTAGNPELEWNPQNRKHGFEGYQNNSLKRNQTTKIYTPNKDGSFTERFNKFVV
jgi:NADH-ubiquinone reductase complex 1 MLRQ subunit